MKTALPLRICFFIFLLFPVVTLAAQLEFKGISMGVSEKAVKSKFTWLSCHKTTEGDRVYGDRECGEPDSTTWKGTFAGASANLTFYFYADKLHRIMVMMKEHSFDAAIEALKAKYGNPSKVETEALQNRMGATFPNHTYLWQLDGGSIKATRYTLVPTKSGGTQIFDLSIIDYVTDYADQEYARRIHPKREKSKKDL